MTNDNEAYPEGVTAATFSRQRRPSQKKNHNRRNQKDNEEQPRQKNHRHNNKKNDKSNNETSSTKQNKNRSDSEAGDRGKSHRRPGKTTNQNRESPNEANSDSNSKSNSKSNNSNRSRGQTRNNRRRNNGSTDNDDKNSITSTSHSGKNHRNAPEKSNHRDQNTKRGGRNNNNNKNNSSSNKNNKNNSTNGTASGNTRIEYPPYANYEECLKRYASKDKTLIRGRLRALQQKGGMAFVSCDRGSQVRDTVIEIPLHRNRALDGDLVFVELLPPEDEDEEQDDTLIEPDEQDGAEQEDIVSAAVAKLEIDDATDDEGNCEPVTWQDDTDQMRLWNPLVPIRKAAVQIPGDGNNGDQSSPSAVEPQQQKGKVIYVIPPKETAGTQPSELNPSDQSYRTKAPRRVIVGTLRRGDRRLLIPNNKSLPPFLCIGRVQTRNKNGDEVEEESALYKAEYVYGSWEVNHAWPPCVNTQVMGTSCNVEDETMALLTEHGVDHGDFPQPVLQDVEVAVQSGVILPEQEQRQDRDFNETMAAALELGWKPTPDMYKGRRDYRKERIFTIDPTTAKDLDDALHIKKLPDGRVEIGVHIADVSHFVDTGTAVDAEAARRATTVYLVDRTVPMLPRPLCEVACSLNENVERLAFSCVWKMNMDGTLENPNDKPHPDDIWYGKTVIKSCARLDYATAQNIIEGKVASTPNEVVDAMLWPQSRQPTGGHTIAQVAGDVRLMHVVAKARRMLRFRNGALALNGVKLAFQLEDDGETPMLCAPYPIRDSNRLVEEYMLLANFLVAQRLISHAGGLALLRQHPPPLPKGLDDVVAVAKAGVGFDIDAKSSKALQVSLNRLGRECDDELVIQCITEMLMTPMQPAEYIAAGEVEEEFWRHFALHIPYYTHFTSPIRRYADVIVHRLLQATIDGEEAVESFPLLQTEIHAIANHCNDKKMASKKAQDRSDRVFLALFLKRQPLKGQMGVVLSVGQKTFTVFVPSLGLSTIVFLDEHKDRYTFKSLSSSGTGDRSNRIIMEPKKKSENKVTIDVFAKVSVKCICKETPPIDVKLMIEGPWRA